jgi:hypothetical protein
MPVWLTIAVILVVAELLRAAFYTLRFIREGQQTGESVTVKAVVWGIVLMLYFFEPLLWLTFKIHDRWIASRKIAVLLS